MIEQMAQPGMEPANGDPFLRAVLLEGSAPVVQPLLLFLGDGSDRPDLRPAAKNARAALIADIAHYMNILHGRHPGVVDHAAHRIVDDAARRWLVRAIDGFSRERAYLHALMVAAGPIHRHVGQDKVTALITGQAKNFEMLATSDRQGCPAGAAIAFVIDWHQTRVLIDRAALHAGLQPPENALSEVAECASVAADLARNDAYARAMRFGAEQLLGQQRGLWQLIAARHRETMAL